MSLCMCAVCITDIKMQVGLNHDGGNFISVEIKTLQRLKHEHFLVGQD